jgi:hypothetical protein
LEIENYLDIAIFIIFDRFDPKPQVEIEGTTCNAFLVGVRLDNGILDSFTVLHLHAFECGFEVPLLLQSLLHDLEMKLPQAS